jgi:hypothetical protein
MTIKPVHYKREQSVALEILFFSRQKLILSFFASHTIHQLLRIFYKLSCRQASKITKANRKKKKKPFDVT